MSCAETLDKYYTLSGMLRPADRTAYEQGVFQLR